MFHFYNFAKCLQDKGAYVHYAWWNNLLAPYMERPLHNDESVPSHKANPWEEVLNVAPFPSCCPKASPRDDYQFQADAETLLAAIRAHNPDAAIVLVGHSMGGDAVARLAANTGIEIALLAPIDPVGNRSCLPCGPNCLAPVPSCSGALNFTRKQTARADWWYHAHPLNPYLPMVTQREFGENIKYLYHRWQTEGIPPFDFLDTHPFGIATGSTNVQSKVVTSLSSDREVPTYLNIPLEGWFDGHGEIVGFRGVYPETDLGDLSNLLWVESHPLALNAAGAWPRWPADNAEDRVQHLKTWEADPNYLYKAGFEPWNPGLCMVSRDLCNILDTIVPDVMENLPPVADAGPDQIIECNGPSGTEVTLDGSGSSDPDDDPLTFAWSGPFGTWMGETIYPLLDVGTHLIILTVDDGEGNTDTDTVEVAVMDSTAPSLSVSLSPNVLRPPNHKMVSISASVRVSDTCDENPVVELASTSSNEADNGIGDGNTSDDIQDASIGADDRTFSLRAERTGRDLDRIYTITYRATDASGNATDATAEVTVPHHGKKKFRPLSALESRARGRSLR
jgi:pimeloyl-ACP methyl ester carboxylesterase